MKDILKGIQLIVNHDADHDPLKLVSQAIQGGINTVQFRHKGPFTREAFDTAKKIADLCHQSHVPLLINDRVDIALAVDACGVHLGQTDLPIGYARKLIGDSRIIGITAYTLEEAYTAQKQGANYIGFGHIFATKTKIKLNPPIGLEKLAEACKYIDIPLIAVGGISVHNLKYVMEAGADGAAIASAISQSTDPFQVTKHILNIYKSYETTIIQ